MAHNEGNAFSAAGLDKRLKAVNTRCVYNGNGSHTDDNYLVFALADDAGELICSTKEYRSGYFINHSVAGNALEMNSIGVALVVDDFPAFDIGFIAHLLHKEDEGKNKTGNYRNNKVENDGEQECCNENKIVGGRRSLDYANKLTPLAHIVSSDEKNCGDGGHRDKLCIGHQNDKHCKKYNGVHHAGNGAASAVFDVGSGACDCAGGGDAAEKGRTDVTHALSDKLGVGVMACTYHTVCDNAAEKRFNGCKNCDGESIGKNIGYGCKGYALGKGE